MIFFDFLACITAYDRLNKLVYVRMEVVGRVKFCS